MALPNDKISTSVVATALGGVSTSDVGSLCTHPNVNPLSVWKPIRFNTNGRGIVYGELKANNFGLSFPSSNSFQEAGTKGWEYTKPNDQSGYRLGDFRGYEHFAEPDICSGYKMAINAELDSLNNGITFGQTITPNAGSILVSDLDTAPFANYYFSVIIMDNIDIIIAKSSELRIHEGGNKVHFSRQELNRTALIDRQLSAYVVLSLNSYNQGGGGGSFYSACNFQGYLNTIPFKISNNILITVGSDWYTTAIPSSVLPLNQVSEIKVNRSHVVVLDVMNNYPSSYIIDINSFKITNTDFFGNTEEMTASRWGYNSQGDSLLTPLAINDTISIPSGQGRLIGLQADWFMRGNPPPANGTSVNTSFSARTLHNGVSKLMATSAMKKYTLDINLPI